MKIVSKKAFSLVELMVVVGLVSIIGAAIASLITSASKSQKGIQAKDQQREVTAEIRNLLSNKIACTNTFTGLNPQSGISVNMLKDANGASKYSINTNDKTNFLTFKSFKVNNWQADAGYTNQGNADLLVGLSKVGDTGTVKDLAPDTITLKIKRDGSGNITECFALGSMSGGGFWQSSPSNSSDIFFSGGNVGVGTSAPSAKLEVNGSIKTGTASTGASCAGNPEGAFAYDSGNQSPVFCSNTGLWTPMGGSNCAGTLVNMYQCPGSVSLGGGAWGYYGCQSQIQSQPTCSIIEYPNSQSFPCNYIGKICLTP
ncbi:type II secretion system GspH family protein [bacterium]|nr:type II secretion system GspH family protein [bacterium]